MRDHWFSGRMFYSRCNPLTATFRVPPGGDGLYYFSTFLLVDYGDVAHFEVTINGNRICAAFGDNYNSGDLDAPQATCSGLAHLMEGNDDTKESVCLVYPFTLLVVPLHRWDGGEGKQVKSAILGNSTGWNCKRNRLIMVSTSIPGHCNFYCSSPTIINAQST